MTLPADRTYADVDPVPLAIEWLTSHPRVLEAFGGPEHVSGQRQDPFPHLVAVAGGETTMPSRIEPMDSDVAFEVWGDPGKRLGPFALRRLSIIVCEAMRDLVEADYVPGRPVVSRVRITRGPHQQDLASGQRRWSFTVSLRMTPPTADAAPPPVP